MSEEGSRTIDVLSSSVKAVVCPVAGRIPVECYRVHCPSAATAAATIGPKWVMTQQNCGRAEHFFKFRGWTTETRSVTPHKHLNS